MRENLSELKLVVIDEMSLIDSDTFYKLDARLKEIFYKPGTPVPFGGVGIILVGDLLQIPPVKGGDGKKRMRHIFSRPSHPINIIAYDLYQLWNLFEAMTLTHNHRQR